MESNRFNGMKIYKYKGPRQPAYEIRGNQIHEYMAKDPTYKICGNEIFQSDASEFGQANFEIRGFKIYEYMSLTDPLYEIR